MARAPRLALAGELHCVVQRGHNGQRVFADDADRQAYLAMLRDAAAQHGLAIHAYALLDAAVHLLATPGASDSLSQTMQSLGRRYVVAFNRRHGRSGTIWEGRFRAGLIDGESLGLDALLMVESMPVVAGLATDAADWVWSSARHHLGRCRDPLVTEHAAYWRLGNTPFEREHAFTLKLRDGAPLATVQRIERAAMQGRAAGSPEFTARIERSIGRPLQAKPRGRPARATLPRAD